MIIVIVIVFIIIIIIISWYVQGRIYTVTRSFNTQIRKRFRASKHHENYLNNFDPIKPNFCIVKLGFTGV